MAFSFRQESNNNWFSIIIAVGVVIVVVGGIYMLFFAKAPLIEVVAPPEVDRVTDLSRVDFGAADFTNSEVFMSLTPHVGEVELVPAGRVNPFTPF